MKRGQGIRVQDPKLESCRTHSIRRNWIHQIAKLSIRHVVTCSSNEVCSRSMDPLVNAPTWGCGRGFDDVGLGWRRVHPPTPQYMATPSRHQLNDSDDDGLTPLLLKMSQSDAGIALCAATLASISELLASMSANRLRSSLFVRSCQPCRNGLKWVSDRYLSRNCLLTTGRPLLLRSPIGSMTVFDSKRRGLPVGRLFVCSVCCFASASVMSTHVMGGSLF